jgi:hypothetical protein
MLSPRSSEDVEVMKEHVSGSNLRGSRRQMPSNMFCLCMSIGNCLVFLATCTIWVQSTHMSPSVDEAYKASSLYCKT